jgi:hypothetical protein
VPLHDRVDVAVVVVAFTLRLVGESVQVRPVVGIVVTDNAAVPLYPSSPLIVTTVLLVDPVRMEADESATWMV